MSKHTVDKRTIAWAKKKKEFEKYFDGRIAVQIVSNNLLISCKNIDRIKSLIKLVRYSLNESKIVSNSFFVFLFLGEKRMNGELMQTDNY